MSELASKIAEVVDEAIQSPEGRSTFRGIISGEEWKIIAEYDGFREEIVTRIKRRDPEVIEWRNA